MQTQINLDGKKLSQIANASHTAEVVMTQCALRERIRPFTDIHRNKVELIRAGEKIVDSDYNKIWEDLRDAGVGIIVGGTNGKAPRFEWHYSMKKVAEAALVGKNMKTPALKAVPAPKPEPKLTQPKVPATAQKVFIPLRADFMLEFQVPSNLTKAEATTIAAMLQRLAA